MLLPVAIEHRDSVAVMYARHPPFEDLGGYGGVYQRKRKQSQKLNGRNSAFPVESAACKQPRTNAFLW